MERHFHVPRFLFVILMILAGSFFVLTLVNFGVGFIHEMHATDGWRAVVRIIMTPFTHPVVALPIASVILRYAVVFILNYLVPVFFVVGMYFARIDYLERHSEREAHSY
ncbi:hypothetical protein MFLO_05725 [Listeria floridensis FSL S10-1187]|uniref:Uncharacterized protein n=1 Tax=Listeria floridensis FSL S10-1187 TaxID=1265817 RepID=A0ABP3B1Z0_9LIST|nr:hypothetical protein [Listeria floridensis]EUJ33068.1 hypothetical protein MFLO_05725 [Listeria floridensis FSL S10-1187]